MILLLEFNELCPALLQQFMERGELPNFKRLYNSSRVYTTDAGESPPNLEPWIQWVTVHSGMAFGQHGVFHLGEGRELQNKCLAELLSDAGVSVGVLGSMNTNYTELNGYYIPDPWDKRGRSAPASLQTFYDVVARQVQDSSNGGSFSKMDMLRFGWFLARHGLRPTTVATAAGQLLSERREPGVKWRRASVLEHIQYDLFRSLNRRFKVKFASLFCNSTAHYQHYYWRNMQPELFDQPPDPADHVSLQSAILYGYQTMDRLVGRVLKDYPQAKIMLCTALSQQAWTDTAKCTYRPRSFEALLDLAGVPTGDVKVNPVMAEEFFIECSTEERARSVETRLGGLEVHTAKLMRIKRDGADLYAACDINEGGAEDLQVVSRADGIQKRFGDLFHLVHSMRSGRHHPDGVLWIRNGRHEVERERVPLASIAPTVLHHFGVQPPDYMKAEPLAI